MGGNNYTEPQVTNQLFQVNDTVIAINNKPLEGLEIAPKLELEKEYSVKQIVLDSKGNQHLDVGLVSELNYVRSWETKEELPDGDKVHWCHPSRFKLK